MLIHVRINPDSELSERNRCATKFTQEWQKFDADAATRAALEEDPYLEVSETIPNNPPESDAAESSAQGQNAAMAQGKKAPGSLDDGNQA